MSTSVQRAQQQLFHQSGTLARLQINLLAAQSLCLNGSASVDGEALYRAVLVVRKLQKQVLAEMKQLPSKKNLAATKKAQEQAE